MAKTIFEKIYETGFKYTPAAKWCIKLVYDQNSDDWGMVDGEKIPIPLSKDIQNLQKKNMPSYIKLLLASSGSPK